MIRIKGLDHVVLRVANATASIRFYCDVLGCTVEKVQEKIGLIQLRAGSALIDLVPVDTGEGNGWGLYNYVGNAREWVREGAGWEVRGGAFENPLDQCDIRLSTSHDGTPDRLTGFRVLRELG